MSKHISQREARRLKKRVAKLEQEHRDRIARYSSMYPDGVNVVTLGGFHDRIDGILYASQLTGHAIVGKWDETNKQLYIYAVKP